MKSRHALGTASTMAERQLPAGMTPRLLSREAAATYCGMGPTLFDEKIASAVRPLNFGRRNLWDVKALDRWLDTQSGLAHPVDSRSMGERLNGGDQGARR
jgi:hypothetical protein